MRNRIWCHNDYDDLESNKIVKVSEQEILDTYWDHWYNLMIKKYGEGHYLITPESCIDDWVVVNWAWQDKNET